MVLQEKDIKIVRKLVRKEVEDIIVGNDPKILNMNFLITKLRELDAYQLEVVQKLNGVIQQMNTDQAKIILLEKFIDRKELGNEYQEFLIKLEEKFVKEEKVPEE